MSLGRRSHLPTILQLGGMSLQVGRAYPGPVWAPGGCPYMPLLVLVPSSELYNNFMGFIYIYTQP
jgi:hypothetical protein